MKTVEMQPYDVTGHGDASPAGLRDDPGDRHAPWCASRRASSCRPSAVARSPRPSTRQVAVCVPYQVPVTVMTTQSRPVAHQVPVTQTVMVPATAPAASGQAATPQSPACALTPSDRDRRLISPSRLSQPRRLFLANVLGVVLRASRSFPFCRTQILEIHLRPY